MPGHELGASYKPVQRRFTGKVEYPLTAEYERGHVETFPQRAERYCAGCGRLPHFCECACPKHRDLRVPGCPECSARIVPTTSRPGEEFASPCP